MNSFVFTGELEKAGQTYELWNQAYPRDAEPHNSLGYIYTYLGQYDKAVAEAVVAIRLSPDMGIYYSNLMDDYLALNRFDEAKITYHQAIDRKLDDPFLHVDMYEVAFLNGDRKEMRIQAAWAVGKPGAEDLLLTNQSDTEAYYGHLRRARDLSREATESARRADLRETAALWQLNSALREAEFGNSEQAREATKVGLAIASTRDVKILAALTLARAGDLAKAEALSEELAAQFPLSTALNRYWLPTIRGCLANQRGISEQGLKLLEATMPYELGYPPPQFSSGGLLYPAYVRGQAYLQMHRGKEAAKEFQKLLDHRGSVVNSPLASLAHLQLGRALSLDGDAAGARKAYQDFFSLWKDADPDIPILKQAKAEYAKLQ